jgi:hypothetical protein
MVANPDEAFTTLESHELIPMIISHSAGDLAITDRNIQSILVRKESKIILQKRILPVSIKKETKSVYYFPSLDIQTTVALQLQRAKCSVVMDNIKLTITITKSDDELFKKVLQSMKDDYSFTIL